MKHYIYQTQHKSGKYYIGRHSATDVDPHYYGSGKWPRSIKDKSQLTVTILEYATDFEHLKTLETQYLAEHIGKPNNMNFNQNSIGFASGDLHPNKSKKQRERLRTNNPGMRPEHKEMMRGESNPAKNIKVRQQISQRMTGKNNPMYRAEVIASRSGDNHPSKKDPTIGSKISLARTGIKLERVICEHCQKSVAINHYPARHKNRCKGVTQP
jgi:hypothetical protein